MTDSDLQTKRLIAAAIDAAVYVAIVFGFWVLGAGAMFAGSYASGGGFAAATVVPRVLEFIGAALAVGYVLCRDIFAGGRSFGKKAQGIRVLSAAGGSLSLVDSAKRNAVFAISGAFGLLSATLGLVPVLGDIARCLIFPLTVLGWLAGLTIAVIEIVKIVQEPDGIRLGDQFAGTRVVK